MRSVGGGIAPLVRARLSPDQAATIRLFEREQHVRVNAAWNARTGFTDLVIINSTGMVSASGRKPFAAFQAAAAKWAERVEVVSLLTGPAA